MAHARQQLREAMVAACTGLTTTGSTVSASMVYPHNTLPSLNIIADNETTIDTSYQTNHIRELTVTVEARSKATADLDDTLDTICAEVETAVMADSSLANLTRDIILSSTEIEYNAKLEQPIGVARMIWLLHYYIDATAPETIITD